jgi:hypothetical protein
LGSGFTNTALAVVEPGIRSHVLRLCERLSTEAQHGPVDLAKWFACFSFDVSPLVGVDVGGWGFILRREFSDFGERG